MYTVKRQIWVKPEAIEGVYSTPTISDAKYAIEPTATPDRTEIEDSRAQRSLSTAPTVIAQKRWDYSYGMDLKGAGEAAGVPILPDIHNDLRIGGFRMEQMFRLAGVAITGTIVHGETFVQATTGATGIIVGAYSGTPTRIHYRVTGFNGALNSGSLVTTSGGATFTPGGASVAHGFAYVPASEIWSVAGRAAWSDTPLIGEVIQGQTSGAVALLLDHGVIAGVSGPGSVWAEMLLGGTPTVGNPTGMFVNGETVLGLTSGETAVLSSTFALTHNISASISHLLDGAVFSSTGCRANLVWPFVTGDPCRMNVAAKGLEHQVVTLPIPTGAVYDTSTAPRFVTAHFLLDGKPFTLRNFTVDMGNNLVLDPDPNAAEGASAYRISARNPRVRLDPKFLPPAAYDFFQKWTDSSLVSAKIRLGVSETDLHNAALTGRYVWLDFPQIQYVNAPIGDRDGIVIADIEGALRQGTTAGNDEIVIYFL